MRGIATLKRAEVQQGRNPAAGKQKAKATAARDWTVRDLAKDYRTKKLVSLAHSTQVSDGRHLKRVEKKLGGAERVRNRGQRCGGADRRRQGCQLIPAFAPAVWARQCGPCNREIRRLASRWRKARDFAWG